MTVQRQNGNWFTNLLNITPTRKFDVVESVWTVGGVAEERSHRGQHQRSFAGEGGSGAGRDRDRDGDGPDSDSDSDRNARAGLVAQDWWNEWQGAIWNSILAGRHGWVTVEDWLEAKMGIRQKDKSKEWGVDYQG